ncbi:MAG: cytochrome c peroxidase [Saprospiraceae bacterium]|nr:cytochrome c peroxidase [Saprospiraceae bacterium]
MKKVIVLSFFIAFSLFMACRHDALVTDLDVELRTAVSAHAKTGSLDFFILPDSKDYAHIPQSPVNPISEAKVELGKLLFHEPCFSIEAKKASSVATFTCASCHIAEAGFRPNRVQGIADGALGFGITGEGRVKNALYLDQEIDAQGARPLSMLNVAFVTNSMWNGSFGHDGVNAGTEDLWGVFDPGTAVNRERLGALEGQNIEGLKTHRINYNKETVTFFGYKPLFDAAFPDVPEEERYTRKTASFAISAYLRTLLCNEAPFQQWLKGNMEAMAEEQKRGALLFFGKAGCYRCHHEPNLGSIEFHALGVSDLFENGGLKTDINDRRNLGRGGFTGRAEDMFRFRVPQLYNMADSGPYFHGSSKKSLRELLHYFNNGVKENPRVPQSQISAYFHPLNLSEQELNDLEAFLRDGLRDPNLLRYKPERVLSGFCFPNNDPISRSDMGCQ